MMENQWGPIADREQEHLTSSDYMIIKVRRRLLKAARDCKTASSRRSPGTRRPTACTASRP